MALPDVQRITHYNNWVVAHAHIGVLGFAGVTALGGLYFILAGAITGKPLHSTFLADLQLLAGADRHHRIRIVLTIVGLIQGQAWYDTANPLPHLAGNPALLYHAAFPRYS